MSPQGMNDLTEYKAAIEGSNQSCGGVEGHAPTCRADIDPEKLADAIAYWDNDCRPAAPQFYTILDAARAHLATLPRYKEVEVERWVIIDPTGAVIDSSWSEEYAIHLLKGCTEGCQVVRLTGTAKVRA